MINIPTWEIKKIGEDMKKVVLMGDSIRMGYDKYVKEALEGVAEVYYPSENCRFAENILRFAHVWKEDGKWPDDVDLVHWNVGLWDVAELFGDPPLTTLDYYIVAIARINNRIRMLYPKAKIIFATSTPVIETGAFEFCRHNKNIEEYNKAAIEVLTPLGTSINDLYSLAKEFPKEYHSDAVHYSTEKGTEMLGGKVISVICRELQISASEVNIDNFVPENYSKDSIAY